MTWFKVDDTLAFHRKAVAAGNAAMGLWVRAGSWSSQQLTDGFVPEHIVLTIGKRAEARRLVEVDLWEVVPGGYCFHGWSEEGRQPSREQVEAERTAARERQRRGRQKARAERDARRDITPSDADLSRRDSGVTHTEVTEVVTGVPTRPDPTRPVLPTEVEGEGARPKTAPRKRATQLPDDFAVTDEMRSWAAEHVPGVDVAVATQKFANHAHANARTLKDWHAGWRNWLLNERPAPTTRGRPTPTEQAMATLAIGERLATQDAQRNAPDPFYVPAQIGDRDGRP